MSVTFQYTNPDINPKKGAQPATRTLTLRHNPTAVDWTYNINTRVYDTYGGQVIQLLSVNIDTLTIQGQLGREGPFGVKKATGVATDRWGGRVTQGQWQTRNPTEQFEYQGVRYPGLHAMVEFFREYFAVVSQGGDPQNPGRFLQIPMGLTYSNTYTDIVNGKEVTDVTQPFNGTRRWTITPVSFPSFRRSNEDFAPEWKVECEIIQADSRIAMIEKQNAIARLQAAVGYKTQNPFSDPLANDQNQTGLEDLNDKIVNQFKSLLPHMTRGEVDDLIWKNVSVPSVTEGKKVPQAFVSQGGDSLSGEIGRDNPADRRGT